MNLGQNYLALAVKDISASLAYYQKLGFENTSAFHSQGLIQLNSQHCKPKKCLNCAIGIDVLKKEND